ncbi:hypothetical protein ABZ873_20120, partial [Streptomyces sp. NPDC047014]
MSMMASPEVNAMIFILTGEKLIDADEDLAFESRLPYSGLGRKLDKVASLIDKSIHDIAESMPDDLAKSYARAMGTLVDDGGKNYLRTFAEQLEKIAEGRRKTSMDIMESKWQVIAEVIRLLIEIAIYLAMSFFTGGASASQIMMAKLRSRFMILTQLSHLLQRLHLAPALTEAFAEAFTTFAVRLAMMNFAPDGRRPDGFDIDDILKSAAFGAAAGFLTSIFDDFAKRLVRSYDNNFLKNGPDLRFKNNPDLRNTPKPEFKTGGPNSKPDPGPGAGGPHRDNTPRNSPGPNANNPSLANNPFTFRFNPLAFKNNPNLWRNNQILRHNADRPGALAGHYALKGTADFLAAGLGEALAEILIKGAFEGDWSTSWSTFLGAGLSSQVEATLSSAAVNSGAELRNLIERLRSQPPTVSGGDIGSGPRESADSTRSRSSDTDGSDHADGPSRTDAPGGAGSVLTSSAPPAQQSTGQSGVTGIQSPPPSLAGSTPPYTTPAPPPYTPGTLPVTAAETELWQQVHQGPAEVREQALRDLAALRGSQAPGSAEIGVRDSLHSDLSQRPEIRVVPAGNSPAAEVDTDAVRRALEGLGTPVTVDTALTTPSDALGNPQGNALGNPQGNALGNAPGNAGVNAPGNAVQNSPGDGVRNSAENGVENSPGDGVQNAPENEVQNSSESGVRNAPGDGVQNAPENDVTSSDGNSVRTSPDGATQHGGPTVAAPEQGTGAPVTSHGPAQPAASGTGTNSGTGVRPGGAPQATGTPTPSGTQPQGARTPEGTAPETSSSPEAASVEQAGDRAGSESTPPPVEGAPTPAPDTTAAPPKVSTTGSYADSGDVRDGRDGRSPVDVKTAPAPVGPPAPTGAQPLTIVVSQTPPPGEGAPEAAELLDGAGVDRAVVLGPAVTPDGSARPVRAAVELTREGPGAPVRVRPLAGPPPAATPEETAETPDTAFPDTAFPGADVLLPLADALGRAPSPVPTTQSSATADSTPAPAAPATRSKLVLEVVPNPPGNGAGPGGRATGMPGLSKHATLSRPWTEPATALHLESGGSPATTPSATPSPTPPPTGQLVTRPAGEPVVTTLDGHTVPVAQLRRWVPKAAVRPEPGRPVQTLTISQGPAEDGTTQSAARRALLDQDTFRGVRTTTTPPAPAPGAVAGPPVRRTVFTGPPAALPGADTERGADYFTAHGTSRTVTLGTDDEAHPTVRVSGVQLGEVLKSWAGEDEQDRPLVLFSCETGRQPRVAGLPVAQHVANRTGRPVYAPTTEVGTALDGDGVVRAVLTEGPDGPGGWRLFTPEPSGAELEGLARDAGLHAGPEPADAFALARTLQQIRTLREVLGPDAEQRPGNRELLAGLAFVDGLRWLSPDTAARYGDGRMSPDLLRRMVIGREAATGGATIAPEAEPTAEQYTAFLRAAAESRLSALPGTTSGATSATPLDSLLPAPPPVLPPTALVSPEDVHGLGYAPAARITWSLSQTPLPLSELGLSAEDSAELARRRPDLVPAPSRPESLAEDLTVLSRPDSGARGTVQADGVAFQRLDTPGDGNSLFRAVLDSARSQDIPPAWAARNIAGLRRMLRDRIAGSELAAAAAEAAPDPVLSVVDDLRMTATAGVDDPAEQTRIAQDWDRIAQAVVTDGDTGSWQKILRDSGYAPLLDIAPTPADARRLGTGELIAAAAELPALAASPFAGLLPQALAHTLDLDLRLVRSDPQSQGGTRVDALHPGARGGSLHLAHDGTGHYDALIPAPAPLAPVPDPVTTPAPEDSDPFGEWLRGMGGITDLGDPATEDAERSDSVPLETQLERYRPARLLTGPDAPPPDPVPSAVTFADGARLPTVLISPDADPGDGTPGGRADGSARRHPAGLFTGPGRITLRSPEQVARQILDQLPKGLRAQFDEAELLRLLTEQPGAFTAPRGARFVGREKSGVGHEMTVEAIPYHRWERFSDVDGGTVRLDTMRRGQAGTGGGRSVGIGRRIAAATSLTSPLNWLVKIGVSLGWTRRTDYTQGAQAYNQSEWRAHEGSHLHLDDVHYRVRVDRVTTAPRTTGPAGTTTPAAPGWQRTQVHTARFAMRDGLSWRLPDDLTVPYTGPRRAPRTLTFPDGVESRITDTTGLHLVDPPEDVALALSGVRPGSSAHRTLVSYVRPGRLLALFGRLSGPVTGPELTRGSGQHPLGHLVVERSVPHRATLVTESVKAELRDLTQTTYQNERGHVRDTRLGIQVTSGPHHTLVGPETDVRVQGGPLVRADLTTGRGHYLGTDAARKTTGRVRNHPVALYRVERTLMVRGAGEAPSAARPVRVVSLDWISTRDAQRLAGWDSRTPGRTGPHPDAEPPVPWYLKRQDPVHLSGQVRAEGFRPSRPPAQLPAAPAGQQPAAHAGQPAPQDPVRAFADTVLETLHRAYPSLFVPPLMLRHPRLATFWYGDGRMRTALHNDRQVREALNRPSLAQSLDDLTTTGIPVTLTEDGKVRRGHHTLILTARLTDRRFETTMSERSLRNAVIGTEVAGQGQQASSTLSAGVELGVSPRDHDKVPEAGLPRQAGSATVGVRHARTDQKATRNTVAVAHDHLMFQNGADLYSYQVELGASFEGHRRPRGWARLATVGLLGAGTFVSKVEERPLFTRGNETVGRVEVAVPAAHGSARHAPADPPP